MNVQSLAAAIAFGLTVGFATPAMARNPCADERRACNKQTEQNFKDCRRDAGKDKAKQRLCEEKKKEDARNCAEAQKQCELKRHCTDPKHKDPNDKHCKGISFS